jgi:NADH dehydrogenase FAD-containing subunit
MLMKPTSATPVVVILGASYAGLMACARLAHLHRQARIIVIANNSHFEQKIRLHESLTGQRTASLALAPLLRRRGVEFIQAEVMAVEFASQHIRLKDQAALSYDYLVYALGSVPQQQLPGSDQYAISLHNRTQVSQVTPKIKALAQQGGHIAVLGGGLTALETITELAASFPQLKLTLVCRQPEFANNTTAVQQHLDKTLNDYGINRQHGQIQALQANTVLLHTGAKIDFDLCIDCTGMKASPIARTNQWAADELGRLQVDSYLRLPSHNNVFVAGDAACASIQGDALRMSCATAMPMGAQAGANVAALISGQALQTFDFGYFARFTSLGRDNAVTQFVDRSDKPLRHNTTGYWATRYKEWICKMTIAIVKWELLTGLKLYYWPTSNRTNAQEQLE